MEYLLFDYNAVKTLVSTTYFQSIEYAQGKRFIDHVCGLLESELLEGVAIEYTTNGILFVGTRNVTQETEGKIEENEKRIFCIDLKTCSILDEADKPSDLLTVLQKSFRTVIRIWSKQPFAFSERTHGTKSIIFPFVMTDRRRIVIERASDVQRLTKRGVKQPLLAYKYSADDAPQKEEIADTSVLRDAGEKYISEHIAILTKYENKNAKNYGFSSSTDVVQITATTSVSGNSFAYMDFDNQYNLLTETQKYVVDNKNIMSPIRVDGAAGTGKTASLIMRAYRLLRTYKEESIPFRVVFFAHNESTNTRNKESFLLYPDGEYFTSQQNQQSILFTTLFEFCRDYAKIQADSLIERDAGDAKTYQLLLIENVIEKASENNKVRTYSTLITPDLLDLFNEAKTNRNVLCAMLQHEFSIQIKGRTNCTIDAYYELESINNGLTCKSKKDKEFIFSLFNDYQNELKKMGSFDIDDVTMEALSHLNAPVWRRDRCTNGYDYIIVDEMHLFNLNEQSIFHFLTKSIEHQDVPICFALDYSQAIGDRGNVLNDYIENNFGSQIEKKSFSTVFRNSPQIANFCSSLAASGTLMFQGDFKNPYSFVQNSFPESEEVMSDIPELYMYSTDDDMYKSILEHHKRITNTIKCRPNEVAIISFDSKLASQEGVDYLCSITGKNFNLLDMNTSPKTKDYVLASPYVINGLEYKAVILVGVDEGRVPQTSGVSDISKHFLTYSAYNLLYLSASRAKYRLILLANKLKGSSSCLEHVISSGHLNVIGK